VRKETVLAQPAKILTGEQRDRYFEDGFLLLPEFVSATWLYRLQTVTNAMLDESKNVTKSNEKFVLERGHSAVTPRLRRLTSPVEHDVAYWEFAANSEITDIAEDLLGPSVKFHHSKLNFKADSGGMALQWHQDFPFMPHTNSCVLTIGIYLADVDERTAPMAVVPGSHQRELFSMYNDKDQWVGAIQSKDLPRSGIERAVPLVGKAGSVTVHHARTVHGSPDNNSPNPRPLLLYMFSAGDAMPVSTNTIPSRYHGQLVRGRRPQWIELEPGPIVLPPEASARPGGIFAAQQ